MHMGLWVCICHVYRHPIDQAYGDNRRRCLLNVEDFLEDCFSCDFRSPFLNFLSIKCTALR